MVSPIILMLVLLALGLLLPPDAGAAGNIQRYTDPQGTIHIDNVKSSKVQEKDAGLSSPRSGAGFPNQMSQAIPSRRTRRSQPEGITPPLPRPPAPPVTPNGPSGS